MEKFYEKHKVRKRILNLPLIICMASVLFFHPTYEATAGPVHSVQNKVSDHDIAPLGTLDSNVSQEDGNDTTDSDKIGDSNDTTDSDTIGDGNADESDTDDTEEELPDYTDKQGIVYECYADNTCCVKGYTREIQDTVVIPMQIHNENRRFTVKGIHNKAFDHCTQLKKIEIPDKLEDVSKKVFKNCPNLTDIYIVPAKITVKKTGKSMLIIIRASNRLLQETEHAKLKIEKSMVQRAVANEATDTITLKMIVTDASGGSKKDSMPGNLALSEAAAKALVSSHKTLQIRIYGPKGEAHSMQVAAANMKQADGGFDFSLQEKNASDIAGSFPSDLKKALKQNSFAADEVKIFTFSFGTGAKPITDVSFYADDISGITAGSMVYLYKYNKNKHLFQVVTYHPQTVSKRGNITVPVAKGGVFLVSKRPFQYMVKKLSNTFLSESGNTYYIDQAGAIVHGWKQIGSDYYYFDRENGKMHFGCQVDDIYLKENGAAVKTAAYVQKIQTMIKARALVEQVTNASDSMSQKIEKCFRWIFQFPYHQYRLLQPIYKQAGWEVTFANDIFDHHQGCCVSEASALAFMFHECGYKTVYVACDTGHAWVELDGRVYDPLFAEARGFDRYYNVSYSSYGLYAVLKRKI